MSKQISKMSTEFKETQKFSQWWLWVLLIGLGLVPIVGLYKQLYLNQAFGDKPMSTMALGIFCLFTFSFIVLFWYMRLKTHINPHGVHMHFFPFIKNLEISLTTLNTNFKSASPSPLLELGVPTAINII